MNTTVKWLNHRLNNIIIKSMGLTLWFQCLFCESEGWWFISPQAVTIEQFFYSSHPCKWYVILQYTDGQESLKPMQHSPGAGVFNGL